MPGRQQHQDFQLAGGQLLGQARHRRGGISPRALHGTLAAQGSQELGQVAERDAAGSGLLGPLGSDQAAQQRAHRRAVACEYPDVTLRAGRGEGLGQDVHRSVVLACGRKRQRLQAGSGRAACGSFQGLLAGPDGRVQAALSALNLAVLIAAPCGRSVLAGRPPPGDAGHEGAFGLREPTAEPLSPGQKSLGGGTQQPLSPAALGQGPRSEGDRTLGFTAELGEIATMERDRRGDIDQHAGSPAGRRLAGVIGRACGRAVGVIEQSFDCLRAAACACQGRLRQQQPGTGPDQVSGNRRKPPLNRRRSPCRL